MKSRAGNEKSGRKARSLHSQILMDQNDIFAPIIMSSV